MAPKKYYYVLVFFFLGSFLIGNILGICSAQDYPSKPIQLISPWPPGGSAPIIAKLVADEANKYLPHPMVLVHKPGAGGTIGCYYVAKGPADGYTLLLTSMSSIINHHFINKFEISLEDFEIIAGIAAAPLRVIVQNNSPWKKLGDLIQYAKQNPGKVTCAMSGTYGAQHLSMLIFEKIVGIKLNYIPFKGGAESMAALAGGHVMLASGRPGEAESLIIAKKVRILSVLDSKRYKFYPDIPCSAEEGYDIKLPKGWRGILAPKRTPKPILIKLENLMKQVTNSPSVIEKGEKLMIDIEFSASEELRRDLQKESEDVSQLAKEIKSKQ